MSTRTVAEAPQLLSEEPARTPGHRRIRARIGGLHCSLCTGTIEKALGRRPGVDKVAVSLTHEQALIEYDPAITRAHDLVRTLKDIGYTVSDPRKLRPFEEEERALERQMRAGAREDRMQRAQDRLGAGADESGGALDDEGAEPDREE